MRRKGQTVIGASKEERDLVARMLNGEQAAFEDFFDAYFPALYRFALSRIGNDEDAAEEMAQAALCKIVRKLSTFRGEASLFSWMCTFCRHEIDAWCKRNRRLSREADLLEDNPEVRAALESLAMERIEPEDELRRAEIARLVRSMLDRLPPHYGSALEWKYLDELSVAEIAERLGLGPKAAESLLTRARRSFRDGFTTVFGQVETLGVLRPNRGARS
jgi:RNA polymerase sigma-70 factor (ECF subfamily)